MCYVSSEGTAKFQRRPESQKTISEAEAAMCLRWGSGRKGLSGERVSDGGSPRLWICCEQVGRLLLTCDSVSPTGDGKDGATEEKRRVGHVRETEKGTATFNTKTHDCVCDG